MKKFFRILLKTIAVIGLTIVLLLAIVFIVNIICNKIEQGKIEHYGQLITVNEGKMNVTIQGKGAETIVLLPGFGTAAPTLDFKPLIEELTPHYRVVSIEPFGYGLSDDTDKERSTDNIVSEIHEALQALKIDRYMLMGHSIAGIYGLDYVNQYPNEVTAFVGIDSSVPTQDGMDTKFPIKSLQLLKKTGIARVLIKFSDDPYAGLSYDDDTKEQIRMITNKNFYNTSTSNELTNIEMNFIAAKNITFPKDLPLLLFVQAKSEGIEKNWIPLHEEQVKNSVHGKVITLDGDHYLHHTRSQEIVENLKEFMDN
ncbi:MULTISPECIES: alpha/beta hydrolase [unclassified Lysinibacillus]|uniref:alpha/beta fold hydrolase n=1 Tax=unclassified Lysinibacillus TaxID=2636778 RepID=UPI00088D83B6|nr:MULTISPECIES: alpha/beta hydrolase [unclassified Lysinibacillus]SCY31849.1 Pimeloyl-ACP methyl ester carboxylesterase [Lysinibacillus sp. SG9]SDB16918.1 Pimeloyl-ACP methyl ester carboxylesterase [Lysinibacillus sp. TC-37]SFS63886.1 Pimeloyl-ACP methyl ester carboxylesterase [Lysinibacillus sp. SG55]